MGIVDVKKESVLHPIGVKRFPSAGCRLVNGCNAMPSKGRAEREMDTTPLFNVQPLYVVELELSLRTRLAR